MALIFADSFDHYVTSEGSLKGWIYSSSGVVSGAGRYGTSALRSGNTNFYAYYTPGASYSTIIAGFAYRASQLLVGYQVGVVTLREGTTIHVDLRLSHLGFLQVYRGATLLATGTTQLMAGAFYYIEIKATINDLTGAVVVRVNGVTEINLSGIDTQNGGTSVVDNLQFGYTGTGFGANFDWDDLYICDTTGSAPNNDFLGDVRVQARLPNGNGNSSVLVGSDGNSIDNYLLVDEATSNGDTDYVESSTVGDKDTYAYENLTPTAGTVFGVQVVVNAKKTDAGVRSIASIARLSITEVDSSDKTLSADYSMHRDMRETKPGGGAWSISDFNSAEFGVKVTA